jgi:hypothetical protein
MTGRAVSKFWPVLALVLTAAPAVAFIPQRTNVNGVLHVLRWSTASGFPIEWRMNPVVGANVTGGREQAAVFREAFGEWADVPTATISFMEGAATASDVKPAFDQINLITTNVTPAEFGSGAIGLSVNYAFNQTGVDQFGRTIEFVGHVLEGDILFNPQTSFSTDEVTPSNRIDLQTVTTHEIGHLLGLDHSNILSSTMFPSVVAGARHLRVTRQDDRIGISTIYPTATFSSTTGTLGGTVRTTANAPVFGALVVAIDAAGQVAASTVTSPDGQYAIPGLIPGSYTVYAEPMNQPFEPSNAFTLSESYPGQIVNTNFTVRYR